MLKGQSCIGCKTSFEQGTSLPLEDLVIQLKNYSYPIRDQKHRWILLKTIVSLLNSKGGLIFIGAQDKTGQVLGLQITRKQQDQFKLFIQKLVQKITPTVDLSNRQDIIMHFIPVMKDNVPTGRFLGKIIVKQGDVGRLYCFSQKVVLQMANQRKYDQFQVVYSYRRINMGSVKELQGFEVVQEAAARAANPPKVVNIFHEGCNPQPISMSCTDIHPSTLTPRPSQRQPRPQSPSPQSYSLTPSKPHPSPSPSPHQQQHPQPSTYSYSNTQPLSTYTIEFTNISDPELHQKLESLLEAVLEEVGARDYNISYEEDTDTLVVQFISKIFWGRAVDLIDASRIEQINQQFAGDAVFSKVEAEDDYVVYENQKIGLKKRFSGQICEVRDEDEKSSCKIETSNQKQLQPQTQLLTLPKIRPLHPQNRSQSLQEQISSSTVPHRPPPSRQPKPPKLISLPPSLPLSQIQTLTITHLSTNRKGDLIKYIQGLTQQDIHVHQFQRTVQFQFGEKTEFLRVCDKLEGSREITKFGWNKVIIFGVCTGQIIFENYDSKKYKEFKQYIIKAVGQDLLHCEFTKKANKFSLLATLKSADIAAKWLDKFITDASIKQFRIPKNQAMKMKIDLVCVKSVFQSTRHEGRGKGREGREGKDRDQPQDKGEKVEKVEEKKEEQGKEEK